MLKKFIIIVLQALPIVNSWGQTFSYERILKTADSLLETKVEKHLIKYFRQDSTILYEYQTKDYAYRAKNKKAIIGLLKKGEKTKGHFLTANINYAFFYPEP